MNKLVRTVAPAVAVTAALLALGGATASATPADLTTLGPDGYKTLKLGMPEDQALATGLITEKSALGKCFLYKMPASEGSLPEHGGVVVSADLKVHSISATTLMVTPEGVQRGAPLSEVKATYPNLTQNPQQPWLHSTPVPGNPNATYTFVINEQQVASEFGLYGTSDGGCGL